MENYVGEERRIGNVVTRHWNDIRGSDREWPERHEIDIMAALFYHSS